MDRPRGKKMKKEIVTQNYLSSLPEDLFLIVLQFSKKREVVSTRPFQTLRIKKCTAFLSLKNAFHEQNLDNMKWIKERNNGDLSKQKWKYFISGTYSLYC